MPASAAILSTRSFFVMLSPFFVKSTPLYAFSGEIATPLPGKALSRGRLLPACENPIEGVLLKRNGDDLPPVSLARHDAHLLPPHLERLGDEGDQLFVGFALYRLCQEPHLEA